jgi:beta-galactosidase/beta-glucuronidase
MTNFNEFRASEQDGSYFRPQLVRENFVNLSGPWEFAFDDENIGLKNKWHSGKVALDQTIMVPFPPESELSRIGDTSFHNVFWYRKSIPQELLQPDPSTPDQRSILHFGAVDYRCEVWLNGSRVTQHEGGHVGFEVDITDAIQDGGNVLVLRVEDDPLDVSQPRGKQDWQQDPHSIWYNRTSGIWQPVWLETVSPLHVVSLNFSTDLPKGEVELELSLSGRPKTPVDLELNLSVAGTWIGSVSVLTDEKHSKLAIRLPQLANEQGNQTLLWSPANPVLIDADLKMSEAGTELDHIKSYLGMRSVGTSSGHFMLNDHPVFIRAVLEQGYWPESHIAAPSGDALKREVELILELGFNTARIHQKIEDPRFLFWADRLGLMIWAEFPATFEFSKTAVSRITREWTDAVLRDSSHPSIVVWVPLNESWGVQQITHVLEQQDFSRTMYRLTKSLDSSRPVISNDGWEHTKSDIATIHDYESDPSVLTKRYATKAALDELLSGVGPVGRRMYAGEHTFQSEPIVVSEFGGIAFKTRSREQDWGYSSAVDEQDFANKVGAMCIALGPESGVIGFCYTQLTDTMQEVNGLLDENRVPKTDMAKLRAAILGQNT